MKKVFLSLALLLWCGAANAQMTDALGALAIGGELSTLGAGAVGQQRSAMNRLNFQQDLGYIVSEIQTTFFGNYKGINKSVLSFSGFQGLNWDIRSEGNGFVLEFKELSGDLCFICQGNMNGAKRAEVVGGTCQKSGNTVKLYYE